MGPTSLRGPSPLQRATGTQLYVARVAGHRQLVLDLIDAGIEPPSTGQDSPLKPDASATRPSRRSRTKSFIMTLYILRHRRS